MEALIKIQMSEGLTTDEVGAFIAESTRRKLPVEEVITEALRAAARQYRERVAARPPVVAVAA
jgi:hypothetical protein